MTRTLVCAVSLTALLSLPALAQSPNTTAYPGSAGQVQGGSSSGTSSAGHSGNPLSADQLKSALKKAGLSSEREVKGRVAEASTSDGVPVFIVVGPKDFKSDKSVDLKKDAFTSGLSKAGLTNVQLIDNAQLVQGMLDDQDSDKEAILAISGLDLQTGSGGKQGSGSNSASLDQSKFDKAVSDAGIKHDNTFKGKLARAQTSQGSTIFLIVGDDDLIAQQQDKSSNFNDKKVRESFQKGELQNFQVLDNVHIVQGSMGDHSVFVVAGQGLTRG